MQPRPLLKASSMANLGDSSKDLGGKPRSDGGNILGKPPPAPTSIVTSIGTVLPKLQELLDHASAHQSALQVRSPWHAITGHHLGPRMHCEAMRRSQRIRFVWACWVVWVASWILVLMTLNPLATDSSHERGARSLASIHVFQLPHLLLLLDFLRGLPSASFRLAEVDGSGSRV